MINPLVPVLINPLPFRKSVMLALAAVVSFHLAYWVPGCQWFMIVFLYCMFQLASIATIPQTICFGMAIGLAAYAPHLLFFWTLFGPGAIALWCVLAFWLLVFLCVGRACVIRFGLVRWAFAAPFVWAGIEYFRSELYYLRFSWLTPGYAFSDSFALPYLGNFGVYGIGFIFMAWVAFVCVAAKLSQQPKVFFALALLAISTFPIWLPTAEPPDAKTLTATGIQLEGSSAAQVQSALDAALKQNPKTDLFVLSEYTFQGPIPDEILAWCKKHGKWLAAGGEDVVSPTRYYDSVFVAGPDGTTIFKQAKSVPVQFMKDGMPAREQRAWDSPWGKIGFGVCYDASYTRVTDELIRQGAQALIFPASDLAEWGKAAHLLDARMAPMRAAEYQIPVFRVCSSGISQYAAPGGRVLASAPYPGPDEMLTAHIDLSSSGRIAMGGPLAQLAVVLTGALILFMMIDKWWAPRPPEPP